MNLKLTALLAWFAVAAAAGDALAVRTVYVDDSVGASGDGSSWSRAFKTIQEAIDATTSGDTVRIAAGTYGEHVRLVDVGFRQLLGAGAGLTVLSNPGGNDPGLWVHGYTTVAPEIRDLTFTGYETGVVATDYPVVVADCSFANSSGLKIASRGSRIEGNLFEDDNVGIQVWSSGSYPSNNLITDNDFMGPVVGVTLYNGARASIVDNRFDDVGNYGITLGETNAMVAGNVIRGASLAGLSIEGGAPLVFNNIFDGNNHAIQITASDSIVAHNTMVDNFGAAVRCLTDPYYDTSFVANNAMLGNGYGLKWEAGCRAEFRNNAGWQNTGGSFVGHDAAYNLGYNTSSKSFDLTSAYRSTTTDPPLCNKAAAMGAWAQVDYYGASRGSSPDIGAVECE